MLNRLQSVCLLNSVSRNLDSEIATQLLSWDFDEEQHGSSIAVMNVAVEAKMVVDEGDVFSLKIDSSDTRGLRASTERLPVLQWHGGSVTAERRNSSSVKRFLLAVQTPKSQNPD